MFLIQPLRLNFLFLHGWGAEDKDFVSLPATAQNPCVGEPSRCSLHTYQAHAVCLPPVPLHNEKVKDVCSFGKTQSFQMECKRTMILDAG